MLINGTPVVLPEATSLELSPGTQPAGTPTLCMEASPSASQSATGPCPDPTCNPNQTWCRKQELERHVLRHLPHHLYCPHPSCGWRGSRRYALTEHYKRKHPEEQALGLWRARGVYHLRRKTIGQADCQRGDHDSLCYQRSGYDGAEEGAEEGRVGRVKPACKWEQQWRGRWPVLCNNFFWIFLTVVTCFALGFTVFTVLYGKGYQM
jgi:hypothetical protein